MWKQASMKTWRKLEKLMEDDSRFLYFDDPSVNNASYIPWDYVDEETGKKRTFGMVSYGYPILRPGALAHELGHAEVHENASPLYRGIEKMTRKVNSFPVLNSSNVLPILGLVGSAVTKNPAWLIGGSGLALALQAPTIIDEYRANKAGEKILKRVGGSQDDIDDMRSGLPSYLAGTLLPAAGLANGLWSLYKNKNKH